MRAEMPVSCGGTICAPSPRNTLYPLSAGGLWRGGDDDAGGGVDLGDRPRQHGRRDELVEQHRPDPVRRHHARGVEREHVALAAGVVADDHAPLARHAWSVVEQVVRRAPPRPGARRAGSCAADRRRRRRAIRRCRTAADRRTVRRARRPARRAAPPARHGCRRRVRRPASVPPRRGRSSLIRSAYAARRGGAARRGRSPPPRRSSPAGRIP